ncbi:hypothetical protein L1987_08600 [Smallanthus sonchifolius]|uniref:Uncharacterized protein n=1 Tax=Smallanthus sonchifolius TaxID=185202 RepID=A0ACB9JLL5_9ASTR|nr:hypothetical protein L1987_08600 [Smallanthus sonchifolius]
MAGTTTIYKRRFDGQIWSPATENHTQMTGTTTTYKRCFDGQIWSPATEVRNVVLKSFKTTFDLHDILISPAAISAAYK